MSEQRGLILCNGLGHVEIVWDSKDDDVMRAVIEKKMKEGVTFFILQPLPEDRRYEAVPMSDIKDLTGRSVRIDDKDIEPLFAAGKVKLHRTGADAAHATVARAKTADEAVKGRSVGVPPLRGG